MVKRFPKKRLDLQCDSSPDITQQLQQHASTHPDLNAEEPIPAKYYYAMFKIKQIIKKNNNHVTSFASL